MVKNSYDPHGAALLDCFRGDAEATLICYQDGARDDVPAAFWLRETIDPLEQCALDLCRGHVLDVGAGSGLHSLTLQNRGFDVTAFDVSAECVTIMRERGVRDAEIADLYEFEGGPFDTIICLCNGLDKVGRLADLPRFLDHMRKLLKPDGRLIADSFDLRADASAEQLAVFAKKEAAGRYFGELDLRFEYKGVSGDPFTVLQVDFETLSEIALKSGWHCELIVKKGGHYLVEARPAIPDRTV